MVSNSEQPLAFDPWEFPRSIRDGNAPANRLIRAAVVRHFADLERDDVYWDWDEWKRYTDLVARLRIIGGHELTGQPFALLPWQSWVVGSVLCWRVKSTGGRRFKSAWVECARGAGKTSLAATLLLYAGFRYEDAKVYCLANTVVQARLAFDAACLMGSAAFGDVNDPDNDGTGQLRVTNLACTVLPTRTKVLPYASKTNTLDGLAGMVYLLDETSEAKTDWMAKIKSALGKSADSMMLSITTPGGVELGRDSPYYQRRRSAVEALDSDNWDELRDTFSALFGIDEDDDMADPEVWIKGQPSLGHVIPIEQYHRQLAECRAENRLQDFERFACCRYSTKGMRWISGDMWEANQDPTVPMAPANREVPVYCAIDLSKSFDVSSMCWGWWESDQFCMRWHHWVIQRNEGDHMLDYVRRLDTWRHLENVTICDHSVQYESVKSRLWELKQTTNLVRIGFDRVGGMKTEVQKWGDRDHRYNAETDLPMTAVPQGMVVMGPATHLLECLVRDRALRLAPDPVVEYALAGVQIATDSNGNRKPCKLRSRSIIDPVVASVMCCAIMIKEGAEAPGAYLDPGDIAI